MTAIITRPETSAHIMQMHVELAEINRRAEELKNRIKKVEESDGIWRLSSGLIGRAASAFDVRPSQIVGRTKKEVVTHARFVVAKRLRESGITWQQIGEIMNRHHSSIIHMVRRYDDLCQYYPEFRERAESVTLTRLREQLKEAKNAAR